jgi:hypothetical protein
MNLTAMNDQLRNSNSIGLKEIVQVIVVAQCLPNNKLLNVLDLYIYIVWVDMAHHHPVKYADYEIDS